MRCEILLIVWGDQAVLGNQRFMGVITEVERLTGAATVPRDGDPRRAGHLSRPEHQNDRRVPIAGHAEGSEDAPINPQPGAPCFRPGDLELDLGLCERRCRVPERLAETME